MAIDKEYYQQHLEWESIEFPLVFSRITSKLGLYNLPNDSIIEVWRGVDFKLKATIEGTTFNKNDIEIDESKLEGKFIPDETITGFSLDGLYVIKLTGCYIKDTTVTAISIEPIEMRFKGQLSIQTITRSFNQEQTPGILFEWFLSGRLSAWFPRSTKREFNKSVQKIREGFDSKNEDTSISGSSNSRDFAFVSANGIQLIIAVVPSHFSPVWATKVCIEYRSEFGNIPPDNVRKAISELVSFILGCQLLKVGYTNMTDKREVVDQYAMNYWGDNVIGKCSRSASPPVNINRASSDWDRLETLLNMLLPTYLKLNDELNLSGGLWKYWVAKDLAVGTNLPIFSSAIESLAGNYLKSKREISESYMDQMEYQNLIQKEINEIAAKLHDRKFRDTIINKIKDAAYRGGNEKISLFFDLINLPVGKVEREAMKARNKMAHSSIETSNDEKLKQYAKLTQAYQTLFHRVFLRLLGYEQDYIDYYFQEVNRPISDVVGANDND